MSAIGTVHLLTGTVRPFDRHYSFKRFEVRGWRPTEGLLYIGVLFLEGRQAFPYILTLITHILNLLQL